MIKAFITKNPIVFFLIKFFALSSIFYIGIEFYMGITSKGNVYIPVLDNYVNFINWYRAFLLIGAHWLTQLIGYHSIIIDKYHLHIIGGHSVQIVFSCLGTGLISVWFAFVFSYPSLIKKKLVWMAFGFLIISFLNMIRLAALVIIASEVNLSFVDHHTYFNISVYICIIIMIYIFTNEKKQKVN